MGKLKAIRQLNELAEDPDMIASIEQMEKDRRNGDRGNFEPRDYYHNIVLRELFNSIKDEAWENMLDDPEVMALRAEQIRRKDARIWKQFETSQLVSDQSTYQDILNIYK